MLWDIFCHVIDNYGDLGVSWRLSRDLASRGHRVRLWVDDASALTWMAPSGDPGIQVMHWTSPLNVEGLHPGDVLLETFGCRAAPEFIAIYADWTRARGLKHTWINLEYLSAQDYVERSHGLPSPVHQVNDEGTGTLLTQHFFYPGFTPRTGGLLREPGLAALQKSFNRTEWLSRMGLPTDPGRLVSLFCYEPPALAKLLDQLAKGNEPTLLLISPGRAQAAAQTILESKNQLEPLWNMNKSLSISYLPYLSQSGYDELLLACDLNFVRGEDSLVRAIWAGQPWVWQIYPQEDAVHYEKLEALLEALDAPDSLRDFHRNWNHTATLICDAHDLGSLELELWRNWAEQTRHRLMTQTDLTSQLLAFVQSIAHENDPTQEAG